MMFFSLLFDEPQPDRRKKWAMRWAHMVDRCSVCYTNKTHRSKNVGVCVCLHVSNERDSQVSEREWKKRSARMQTTQSFEHWIVCWHMKKHAMPCHAFQIECVLYIYTNAACKIRLAETESCVVVVGVQLLSSIGIQAQLWVDRVIWRSSLYMFDGKSSYFILDAFGDVSSHLLLNAFSVLVCFDSEFSIEMSTAACMHMK